MSLSTSAPDVPTVDYAAVAKVVKDRPEGVYLIDVREPAELLQDGLIPGSKHVRLADVSQSFAQLSEDDFRELLEFDKPKKSDKLIFYCKAGMRAMNGAKLARQAGYENVAYYPGSILDWNANKK